MTSGSKCSCSPSQHSHNHFTSSSCSSSIHTTFNTTTRPGRNPDSTMAQPVPPQQLILPTIYALLPPASYASFISQLSLLAIHAAPYTVRDDIYHPTNTVLPQPRTLRLRAKRRPSTESSGSRKGKEKEVVFDEEDDENWDYDLNYVSGLMNASEYRDMEVRSYIGVDVLAEKSREGIESFLEAMDFK